MLPELNEIRQRRKRFNLTQAELAELARVSQSLIAKIESGNIVPSYEKAKRLFDSLERLQEESTVKAVDIMSKRVVSVQGNDSVKKAIRLMEKKAFSQLPVIEDGKSIGTVSEKTILNKLSNLNNVELAKVMVKNIMDESLPLIQENTPIKLVSHLLEFNQALLVARKGKIVGIIAKADLLKAMLLHK